MTDLSFSHICLFTICEIWQSGGLGPVISHADKVNKVRWAVIVLSPGSWNLNCLGLSLKRRALTLFLSKQKGLFVSLEIPGSRNRWCIWCHSISVTQVQGWNYCDDDSVHQLYTQKIKVSSRKAGRRYLYLCGHPWSLDFTLKYDILSRESRVTGRGNVLQQLVVVALPGGGTLMGHRWTDVLRRCLTLGFLNGIGVT